MQPIVYSLLFHNGSSRSGAVCVYQTDAEVEAAGVRPVAWLVKKVAPTTSLLLRWSDELAFVWRSAPALSGGVDAHSWQAWPADLDTRNQVTLRRDDAGYTFSNESQGRAGAMVIVTDASVSPADVSVGVGMAELPTFVIPAAPNMQLTFAPRPQYWIAFGDFEPGQLLDPQTVAGAARLLFSPTTTALAALLQADNTWRITPC